MGWLSEGKMRSYEDYTGRVYGSDEDVEYWRNYGGKTPVLSTKEAHGYFPLKAIGKGSAFCDEINSCFYLINGTDMMLVDCGENTFSGIKKVLEDNPKVRTIHVLITHLHADHVGGLSTLIYYAYYVKGIYVKLHLPPKLVSGVETLLSVYDNPGESYTILHMPDNGIAPIHELGLEIGYVPTEHKETMNCYGILFMATVSKEEFRYYYLSGDSCTLPKTIRENLDHIETVWQDVSIQDFGGVHMYYKNLPNYYPIEFLKSDRFEVYHCEDAAMVNEYIENLKF